MPNNKQLVCAHYMSGYLPLTENWIYKVLINFKQFTPIVLTRKLINPENFPLSNIHNLKSLGKTRSSLEILAFKIGGYIPYFYNICRKEGASILHVHFGNHGVKSTGLKKKLKVPMVCSFYGADAFKITTQSKVRNSYKNMFRDTEIILVLGEYMKDKLLELGCPENKLVIHHLGIDTKGINFKQRNDINNRPVRFLLASSFVPKKGIDDTLKALSLIKDKFSFTVDIIGDGPLRSEIEKLINENGLKEIVTLHGYKPYGFFIEKSYECDIFLQASKTTIENDKEGTPMSLVDAMATGMPVVSTRHSDIPEIVIDGYNGYLAEENNYTNFAANLEKILTANNFAELSKNARTHIEQNFDALKQDEKLEKIYKELIISNQNK